MDKRTPYVFDSDIGNGSARTMGKIWFGTAIFFALWDAYALVRYGHIVGGVFLGLLFGVVAGALYTLKGTITISNEVYHSTYRVYGLPFTFEMPIKGWQILHVDYRTLHVVGKGISNQPYIQFYLCARDDGQPQDHFSLAPDLYFDLNHDPIEVASVIKKLKDATGFKLTFGGGPMRDIYPTYKKLYGELND